MLLASEGQSVAIETHEAINCLSVCVSGGSPMAVLLRVMALVKKVSAEVMSELKYSMWLCDPSGDHEELLNRTWLQLDLMQKCVEKSHDLVHANNSTTTTCAALRHILGDFAVDKSYLDAYDIFLSYRWGQKDNALTEADTALTEAIFEYMARHNVGSPARAIAVFRDRNRLPNGMNFLDAFAKALCGSKVLVPIVSAHALERMRVEVEPSRKGARERNAAALQRMREQVDYTLLEWVMGLVCYEWDPSSPRKRRLYPFMLGGYFGYTHSPN